MDVKKIGAFIALNRKEKGMTQEQLGEKLGVTNKTISRWENGNYMPDLSLLEPLSQELGITLNELLAGEKIEKEKSIEYSEKNIKSTLDYSTKEIQNEHKKISILIMGVGILICIYSFNVISAKSNWSSLCSIMGLILLIVGIYRLLQQSSKIKKWIISICLFLLLLSMFFVVDFIGVNMSKRPPIYRCLTKTKQTDTKIIEYENPFYNVYQINADTSQEYYIIDTSKEYTIHTVPISPFHRDKSGIDHILKYQNPYIGNNSNIGALIESLPLSEYGYVFEIQSQDYGLVIDYHFTDWYKNDNLYVEKSMIYNSASIFALIENVEYIQYNFSGSSYRIDRNHFENKYPHWNQIINGTQINKDYFNQYIESKINDCIFVKDVFQLFHQTRL